MIPWPFRRRTPNPHPWEPDTGPWWAPLLKAEWAWRRCARCGERWSWDSWDPTEGPPRFGCTGLPLPAGPGRESGGEPASASLPSHNLGMCHPTNRDTLHLHQMRAYRREARDGRVEGCGAPLCKAEGETMNKNKPLPAKPLDPNRHADQLTEIDRLLTEAGVPIQHHQEDRPYTTVERVRLVTRWQERK